jgi:preprotein translocase subunit SecE
VARNRQRAKQRQAERRAERLSRGQGTGGDGDGATREQTAAAAREEEREELLHEADLAAGAPPEDLGRTDQTLAHAPIEGDEDELDDELEDYDFEDEEQPLDETATAGPRGVRGGRRAQAEAHHRNRLVAFLIAVWAELQRVQWPNRKQLTQMTGIVLLFVLIAGGYLGLLDAVFSRLIQAIL